MKTRFPVLIFTLLAAAGAPGSAQTITLEMFGGSFYQVDGTTLVPTGSVGVLVLSTTDNDFASIADLDGRSVADGTLWGDDLVLRSIPANNDGTFNDTFVVSYTGGIHADAPMAFYWFPELASVGGTITATMSWGFWRSDEQDTGSGSDIAFILPTADGFDHSLYFLSDEYGGVPATIADFTAMAGVAAVPEPASCGALFGVAGLSLAAWRRRRPRVRTAEAKA